MININIMSILVIIFIFCQILCNIIEIPIYAPCQCQIYEYTEIMMEMLTYWCKCNTLPTICLTSIKTFYLSIEK